MATGRPAHSQAAHLDQTNDHAAPGLSLLLSLKLIVRVGKLSARDPLSGRSQVTATFDVVEGVSTVLHRRPGERRPAIHRTPPKS